MAKAVTKFSIVVPVYQNEANLSATVPKLLALEARLPDLALELVFIDDGSTDTSYALLKQWHAAHPDKIKVVKLTRNFGQIAAIQAGIRETEGACVGFISADLQDPSDLFLEMIEWWKKGFKLVIAERSKREETFLASVWSRVYWYLVSRLALPGYPTGGFDFCLIDRQIVVELNKFHEKNTHIFPLIFSFGYQHKVLPYTRGKRLAGKTQWTLSKKIKLFLDTFIAFSYFPIRSISYIGIAISIPSLLFGFYAALSYFLFGNKYTGWTTLAVLSSVLGGFILITLGIIGEYLWRILDAVRLRPPYLVDEKLSAGETPA